MNKYAGSEDQAQVPFLFSLSLSGVPQPWSLWASTVSLAALTHLHLSRALRARLFSVGRDRFGEHRLLQR